MVVIMRGVVMRRSGVEVILGGGAKPKDYPWIHRAFGHLYHWQWAWCFGGDPRPSGGDAFGTSKIRFGQQDNIGTTDLVFEHFRQRRFVVDTGIGGALGITWLTSCGAPLPGANPGGGAAGAATTG